MSAIWLTVWWAASRSADSTASSTLHTSITRRTLSTRTAPTQTGRPSAVTPQWSRPSGHARVVTPESSVTKFQSCFSSIQSHDSLHYRKHQSFVSQHRLTRPQYKSIRYRELRPFQVTYILYRCSLGLFIHMLS